mmetsp:Transcript_3770/g.9425  ORF Transcript_3770/g.9425 Transcript_3770/m.9425 type:complete len:345 (-) Transcript_3770:2033-3067(-)
MSVKSNDGDPAVGLAILLFSVSIACVVPLLYTVLAAHIPHVWHNRRATMRRLTQAFHAVRTTLLPTGDVNEGICTLVCRASPDLVTECVICMYVRRKTFIVRLPCGASACLKCIRRQMASCFDESKRELQCLYCRDELPQAIIRDACYWRPDLWRRYLQWSLTMGLRHSRTEFDEEPIHCPSPGCNHTFLADRAALDQKQRAEPSSLINIRRIFWRPPRGCDGHTDARRVTCNACRQTFCILCGLQWEADGAGSATHDGRTCVAYRSTYRAVEAERARLDYYRVGRDVGAATCPTCSLRIVRSFGCDRMVCSNCRTAFCYRCGRHWGLNGHRCSRPVQQQCAVM